MTESLEPPTFEIPVATRPASTTTSADGTRIAFDLFEPAGGDGTVPLVVLVDGATATRLFSAGLGQALAAQGVAALAYDRRGRGDSGDTAPYAVDREAEDLAAVVEAARPGGRASVVAGFSSGAALVLRAAAAAAPFEVAVAFEPPYRVEGSPPLPADYTTTLEAMTAAGRLDDAYEYFMVRAVGMPEEMVAGMRGTPMWQFFRQTAPTLAYDGHCLGGDDHSFPTDLVAGLDVPVVALASSGSPEWLQAPARQVGDVAPRARFEVLDGEFHHVPDDVLAPVLAAIARG